MKTIVLTKEDSQQLWDYCSKSRMEVDYELRFDIRTGKTERILVGEPTSDWHVEPPQFGRKMKPEIIVNEILAWLQLIGKEYGLRYVLTTRSLNRLL